MTAAPVQRLEIPSAGVSSDSRMSICTPAASIAKLPSSTINVQRPAAPTHIWACRYHGDYVRRERYKDGDSQRPLCSDEVDALDRRRRVLAVGAKRAHQRNQCDQ